MRLGHNRLKIARGALRKRRHFGFDHDADEFLESFLVPPAKFGLGAAGIGFESIDLGGSQVSRVRFDKFPPVKTQVFECDLCKTSQNCLFRRLTWKSERF